MKSEEYRGSGIVETSKQVSYTRACDTDEQNIKHLSFAKKKKKSTKLVDLGNGIESSPFHFDSNAPNLTFMMQKIQK
jgi:hypothetical protein